MAPIPSNAKHNGSPSSISVEYQTLDIYPNPKKFEKKAVVTIFGTHKGYGTFTQGSVEFYLKSIGDSAGRGGAHFERLRVCYLGGGTEENRRFSWLLAASRPVTIKKKPTIHTRGLLLMSLKIKYRLSTFQL